MSSEQVRVGIIGLGRSGWNIHAAGLRDLGDQFRLVAASDPLAERRTEAEADFGAVTYSDPEQLLADGQVELVVVATPSHTHVPLGLAALQSGKHVVIEKPMAQSVEEIDQLTAAAKTADRMVTCFQNNRFEPSFLKIREIIDSGRIGEVLLIRRSIHRFGRRADWQTLRAKGGGELPNTASHFLDQLLLLVGDSPVSVFADLRRTVSAGDAEDHVKLTLKPEKGPVVEVESSAAVAFPQTPWFIAGTAGGIIGSVSELQVRWFDPASLPELEADPETPEGRKYGYTETIDWSEETIEIPPPKQRTQNYYRTIYATLREGADLFVTPDSVRRQIGIINEARHQTNFL